MPNRLARSSTRRDGFQLREIQDATDPRENGQQPAGQSSSQPDYKDLGDLPRGYGEDLIFLIAQEPHWLFTYWDIDISRHPGGPSYLRIFLESGEIEAEVEVPFETRNWYIPVRNSSCPYLVEIGHYRAGEWVAIARSIPVETPAEGMSDSDDFRFATLPFHLSFQRLVNCIEDAVRSGEDLMQTLANMQKSGDFSAFGAAGLAGFLNDEQRAILAALLGPDLIGQLSSGSLSSAAMETQIRNYIEERLSSEGASEQLAVRFREFAGSENLFSGFEFPFAKQSFASWSVAEISSWAVGIISSWSLGVVSSWSGVTSWSGAAGGVSSAREESLASWLAAGETGESVSLSSWMQSVPSVWAQFAFSSWLQGVQSSWEHAAISSWSAGAMSSWLAASTSSWGGSETVSSFSPPQEHAGDMDVKAEVILRGASDSSTARITIDGNPVPLNADCTFHYHFILPNQDCEIPVIAESSTGGDTQTVVLRISRETIRSVPVSPSLPAPMGRLPRC